MVTTRIPNFPLTSILTGASSQQPGFAGDKQKPTVPQIDFSQLFQQAQQFVPPAQQVPAGQGLLQALGLIAQAAAQTGGQAAAGQGISQIAQQQSASVEQANRERAQQIAGFASALANVAQANVANQIAAQQQLSDRELELQRMRQRGEIAEEQFAIDREALQIEREKLARTGLLEQLLLQGQEQPQAVEEVSGGPGVLERLGNFLIGLGGTGAQAANAGIDRLTQPTTQAPATDAGQLLSNFARRTGTAADTATGLVGDLLRPRTPEERLEGPINQGVEDFFFKILQLMGATNPTFQVAPSGQREFQRTLNQP